MRLKVREGLWPLDPPLRIARGSMHELPLIVVVVEDADGHRGRGEAVGVPYDGETPRSMIAQIEGLRADLARGMDRAELQSRLPAGGARNALDCALWDLEAKQTGTPVWRLAGLSPPAPFTTAFTIGLGDVAEIRSKARAAAHLPLLKVKLDAARAADIVRLVREEAPAARIVVDANQAWDLAQLNREAEALAGLGVSLIEQPLPRGRDQELTGYIGGIPLAADESCTDRGPLPALAGLYQAVNIKLDKAGGLTEALAVARDAREMGFSTMVGCMAGTSLSMAPASLLAEGAVVVDLDGPLLHGTDRPFGLTYRDGIVQPADPRLWG